MLLNCGVREDLRVSWTARRSNQSILKEISPEYSLEGLMLKLKLQYLATWCEELTHLKRPWYWERLMVGGEGENRGWDGWMASLTQWTWVWVYSGNWWWTGRPGMLQSVRSQRVKRDWVTELTELTNFQMLSCGIKGVNMELPWWLSSKEYTCQRGRRGFDSWVEKIPWRRKWQPTPMFLPWKSLGQRSLAGYSPRGCKRAGYVLVTKQEQTYRHF